MGQTPIPAKESCGAGISVCVSVEEVNLRRIRSDLSAQKSFSTRKFDYAKLFDRFDMRIVRYSLTSPIVDKKLFAQECTGAGPQYNLDE